MYTDNVDFWGLGQIHAPLRTSGSRRYIDRFKLRLEKQVALAPVESTERWRVAHATTLLAVTHISLSSSLVQLKPLSTHLMIHSASHKAYSVCP